MKRGVKEFLNPKSIAIIGASNEKGKVGNILIENLAYFKGKIIPINPYQKEICGMKSYASVLDYPKRISLAVIATPAEIVKSVIVQCGEKRIKNVIIISAGFSERGNKKLEQEILSLAQKYKIRLLGPNCFGVANPEIGLDLTFAKTSAKKGNIAFLSQSGALWSYLADISHSENLGFSGYVSLGNMLDLEFVDFLEYFLKDEKTKKIILYVEKLKRGKKFIELCKKSRKEIVVIKAGRTSVGKETTLSHTGSLATNFDIYKGAMAQASVRLEKSFEFLFKEYKEIVFTEIEKIGIITNAGGAGALVTDSLIERGYIVNPPVDILGTALAKDYKRELDKMKSSGLDLIIVILTPQSMSEPLETAKEIVKFSEYKRVYAIFLGEASIKEAKEELEKNKIPYTNRI